MIARPLGFLAALTSGCFALEPPPEPTGRTAVPEADLTPGLVEAINSGNPARVRELLDAGVPAGTVSADGDTPLCAALRAGFPEVAAELLRRGADPRACGPDGHPPLALAALRRNAAAIRLILDAGVNPNLTLAKPLAPALVDNLPDDNLRSLLRRERRVTVLMACAVRGDVEAVTLLLNAKATPIGQTSPGRYTALDLAAQSRYLYLMRLLLGRDPENEPETIIRISLSRQKAALEIDGITRLETTISTGRMGYGTPQGRYVVTHKYRHWRSTIYKVPMPYFMRLNCGNFGLHSGYVTGAPASHGCIRLPDDMARKFFEIITPGDQVVIEP